MLMTCFSFTASVSTVAAADTVVYVNGEAETNGDGTKDSPYNTLLAAVKALQNTGGTVIVTGVTELTNNAFVNKAKVTVTSLEGTTDYRGTLDAESGLVSGAYLLCKSTSPINLYSGSTAEVEFNNLNIVWAFNYTAINLTGRTLTYGENTRWYEQKTRNVDFYVDGFSESLRLFSTSADQVLTKNAATFNSGAGSAVTKVIAGERCELTTSGYNFNIDGYVKELHISSESNNSTSGKLTVDGDVKINLGSTGTIAKLTVATAGSGNTKGLANQKLLEEIKGALSIAVNHGGKITTNDISLASTDYKVNKMFIVNGAENLTVKNGAGHGSFVVETDADFNAAVITDASGNRTVKILNNKSAEFVLTESGTYNVTLESIEVPKYTVTFKDYDGTEKGTFVAEEDSVITDFPEAPFRAGYEFVMWSVDGKNPITKVSAKNETATAVYKEETRKVVFVNGEIAEAGDGKTPTTPYKDLGKAANDVAGGGVIVVTGKTDLNKKNFANTEPILLTSVYNTVDYRGELNSDLALEGAYLFVDSNSPYTNTGANDGLIEFDNVNVRVRGQYGALNMGGHSYAFGEGFAVYEPTENKVTCETFRLATTFSIRSYDITESETEAESAVLDSYIDGKIKLSNIYLGTRGKKVIPGRNIIVNGNLGSLRISSDLKKTTQGQLTVKGDIKVTVNGSVDNIEDVKVSGMSGLAEFKGNLSVIVNHGGTLKNVKDGAMPTNGKYIRINGSEGGKISHTEKSLEYKIELDEGSTYNYATVSNGESSVGVVLGDGSGTFKLTSAGEYTVTYGTTSIYTVTYTDNVGGNEIDDYYVEATDTEGLTITLPTLSKTNSERFLGWATSEDADTAEYLGGESVTIDGSVDFYAVWENIPTFTVTFMTEDGEKISDFTAYEGADIVFPESKNYHKYGYTLIGWAEENSTDTLTVVPASDVTLYPIYKAKSGADTVVYLNGTKAENGDGKSPDTAFNHIQSAIDAVKANGGKVVVTGVTSFRNSTVSPAIAPTYNNAGDIVFTSYDSETETDYRAKYDSTSKTFDGGAYIYYTNGIGLGQTVMTGGVTFENCILVKSKSTYLNFDGHPATIGKGVSVYQGTETFTASALQMRGLGEAGSTKSNPDGLFVTLNGLDAGSYSFTVGGIGDATVKGINLTVDSAIPQAVSLGGNNATLTVEGDIIVTLNANIDGIGTDKLVHKSGNFTLLLNNNVDETYDGAIPEGYAFRSVKCEDSFATLSIGEDASKVIVTTEPTQYSHVELYTIESVLVDVAKLSDDYTAEFTVPEGSYVVSFTDAPAYSISFDTQCDTKRDRIWCEADDTASIPAGVKNLGYLFGGWEYEGTIYNEGDAFLMPAENITMTAIWTVAPEITLTLDANGYGENPDAVVNYIYEFSDLPVLSDENAYFIGWGESADSVNAVLTYQLLEDKTLYAIWSDTASIYTVNSRYSKADSAYMSHVFLEGDFANSGSFTQTFNDALAYASVVNAYGVEATATVDGNTVTVEWEASDEEYRISDKKLLFTIAYNCAKDDIAEILPQDIVYAQVKQTAGDTEVLTSVNTEKAEITAYGTFSGLITLDEREVGVPSAKETMLYVVDSDGDVMGTAKLESVGDTNDFARFSERLPTGEYTLRIIKAGYIERTVDVRIDEGNLVISDTPLFGGDIPDNSGLGDGVIDIDDFIRILRGFSEAVATNPVYKRAIDINEDGVINVSDLSIIKQKFSGYIPEDITVVCGDGVSAEDAEKAAEIINGKYNIGAEVGEADGACIILSLNDALKLRNWELKVTGTTVKIDGGSTDALLHAVEVLVSVSKKNGSKIFVPGKLDYEYPYTLEEVTIAENDLVEYSFVVPANDEYAQNVHGIINDYLIENYGYVLPVRAESAGEDAKEILIGTASAMSADLEDGESTICVSGNKIHLAYNGEYASEITAYNFIERALTPYNENYTESVRYLTLPDNWTYDDKDEVSSTFLLMSDTHVESDFLENGRDVYTMWKPDFEALISTYGYINDNFDNLDFALFCGDSLNTGYAYQAEFLNAERENYFRTLEYLDIYKNTKGEENISEKFNFSMVPSFVERNTTYYHPELDSRLISIQGNHDTGVEEYYRDCAFTNGNTRFICFFASYVGLPAPAGTYKSTGKISDATIAFIENELKATKDDDSIEHIILVCHWSISHEKNFTWPIYDACPENGYSNNRQRLLDLAEEYGCDFYINGHEHNANYPTGKAGILTDINIASATSRWAVVKIHNRKIVFDVYSTAVANTKTGDITTPCQFVKTVTVDLTPREILTRK